MRTGRITTIMTTLVFAGALCWSVGGFAADDVQALKAQITQLNARIAQLEGQLAQKNNSVPVDLWDPFEQMDLMQQRIMNMADRMDRFDPRIDIKESPKQYIITMDIPGMDKNNIEVNVKEHHLIISGERNNFSEEDKKGRYFRQERSFGHFVRALPLPEDVDESNIDAQYDKGVLTVTLNRLAKTVKSQTQKIPVK